MRYAAENGPLRLKVVTGTRVVLMAWDLSEGARQGLRGFAIQRLPKDRPPEWMTGTKYFEAAVDGVPPADAEFSTREHPLQTFLWSDYEAWPGRAQAFRVVALYGEPGHLTEGASVQFEVTTEAEREGTHSVWFNRGAIASHAYATDHDNKKITEEMVLDVSDDGEIKDRTVAWLSRGLAEACLRYINSAKVGEGLRVCAYEFTYLPVLFALRRAMDRGVDVRIVYHYSKKDKDPNFDAIEKAEIPEFADIGGESIQVLFQRTRTSIPHNKFIVRLVDGKPVEVWTGSTNFTDTGMFGQTNVGHVVRDGSVAEKYLAYWELVKGDLTGKNMVAETVALSGNPSGAIGEATTVPFFSPRIADNMLDWYAARIRNARSFAGITLAFNVANNILGGLAAENDALRLAILENPSTKAVKDAEFKNRGRLAFSNGAILGKTFIKYKQGGAKVTPVANGELDQWYISEELARPINRGHVFFVHSKFVMIDPLSEDPLICSGSANFSVNSLEGNDENMLLIRGDKRVADIYFTEFDRIFRHFYSRDAINRIAAKKPPKDKDPRRLDPGFAWIGRHYEDNNYKNTRRLLFFPVSPPETTWAELAGQEPDIFADEAERAARKKKAKAEAAKKK
ncbi:Phospholipase D domain-containing protein [Mesorhizobium prunaredense]|uniref:phospholipase D n=1 Tax=Mesorhizobium prunaredense TaxID=1631249 RepID=A0A1R3VBC2_9HYPH|nr:phospholipase D-like domain-containing protein [Mesorhizobium prunaredense]SIT57227.1 Phospholipase D domain-containing protein [Mesorhizobium prunaredense]